MEVLQSDQTTIEDLDSSGVTRFWTVPAHSLSYAWPPENILGLLEDLGLPIAAPARPATLVAYLYMALTPRAQRYGFEDFPFDLEPNVPFFYPPRPFGRIDGRRLEFAEYLAFERLIPFESSPLRSESLAAVLSGGTASAKAVGYASYLVLADGSPLLVVVAEAGIVHLALVHAARRGAERSVER